MTTTSTRRTPRPRTGGGPRSQTGVALLFLAPALLGFAVFYLRPMVKGFELSLTRWDLLTDPQWVGIDNYKALLYDATFDRALLITAVYVVVNITTQTAAGLGIAVLMQKVSQSTVVRSLLVVPWLVPNVTIAVITLFILDPNVGLVNHLLGQVCVGPIAFYGNPDFAIITVALVNSWRNMGYTALLIFAGMQLIPKMIYESADIDGANQWKVLTRITLPLIRPILAMVVVVSMIGSFQIFDTVAVATKGGPVGSTRVIYFYIYEKAFQHGQMGYAAAMSVVLLLIILVMSLFQLRVTRAAESDLG